VKSFFTAHPLEGSGADDFNTGQAAMIKKHPSTQKSARQWDLEKFAIHG
jgi:hypothetical protein